MSSCFSQVIYKITLMSIEDGFLILNPFGIRMFSGNKVLCTCVIQAILSLSFIYINNQWCVHYTKSGLATLKCLYCMKPYKIKGLKCAIYSIKCASVLYLAHNSAILAIRVLYILPTKECYIFYIIQPLQTICTVYTLNN